MRYKRILAAINEHVNSEVGARYALNFARACGAALSTCFIAGERTPPAGLERAKEAMRRLFREAERMGVTVEEILGTGDPVREITEVVRRRGIDLVFASTRREDVERRFYAGTTARRLSLRLPCSVALVRVVHIGRIRPSKILVPLKARVNRVAERAYFTAKMAEAFRAGVVLFHAPRPMTRLFRGEIHLTPIEWQRRTPADIAAFRDRLGRLGVEVDDRLAPGPASRTITTEAAARRHDLIIMGASERSLVASFFKGNPVEAVLRETPCDLIILKPHHED